jgi:TonB dependent receptor.
MLLPFLPIILKTPTYMKNGISISCWPAFSRLIIPVLSESIIYLLWWTIKVR